MNAWLARALDAEAARRDGQELLAKLTVVIPSYGRQDFLLRQIAYWGRSAARIVIVDGSPQPLQAETLEIFADRENIRYLHLPDTIYVRLRLASRHIHTPYAIFLGDDEFLLKRGLCRAIEVLERDTSLAACAGQSLKFHLSKDGAAITYGAAYSYWKYAVPQDSIRERLRAAMAGYNAVTCYAVLREPAWSRSWGAAQPWSHIPASEIQQAVVTYIHGKLATVDAACWLRSSEHAPVVIKKVWEPHKLTFPEWWSAAEHRQERESFVEALIGEAVSSGGLEQAEAREAILEAVDTYLDYCSRQQQPSGAWAALKENCRKKIRSLAGGVLRALLSEKQLRGLMSSAKIRMGGEYGSLDELKRSGEALPFLRDEELYGELREIEEFVAGFYRARREGA